MTRLETLRGLLGEKFPDVAERMVVDRGQIAIECDPDRYHGLMGSLKSDPDLDFTQCVDLCGMDYMGWPGRPGDAPRFAVVCHLLSYSRNWRLRVRCFAADNDFPILPTITDIYEEVDWFEREAFDMYGVVFEGHPDLRRILTDYGFVGHPLRKDFPCMGHVEMVYDEATRRVIYRPVTIDLRNNVPRVVREENYGG